MSLFKTGRLRNSCRLNIFLSAVSVTVGLAIAEFLCRNFDLVPSFKGPAVRYIVPRKQASSDLPYPPNSKVTFLYRTNPRQYGDKSNKVLARINSHGFRGKEVSIKRNKKTRIALFGDSFTFGYGVKEEHTSAVLLEQKLSADGFEVLNFGVVATDTRDQLDLLQNYGLRFKPDLVVIILFLNDAVKKGAWDFLYRKRYSLLSQWSFFVRSIDELFFRFRAKQKLTHYFRQGFLPQASGFRNIREALLTAKKLSQKEGFRFVVAVHPALLDLDRYPFDEIHQNIATFCQSNSIQHLDLLTAFRGLDERRLWIHPYDHHPNEIANEITARALANKVSELINHPTPTNHNSIGQPRTAN